MGKLVVAGWHIGSVSDLPRKTAELIMTADLILCENKESFLQVCKRDKLAHIDNIKEILEYYEPSKHQDFIDLFKDNETVVMVCYEGMPTIADPGEVLVKIAHINNIKVDVIPGPVAPITSLAVSGLKTSKMLIDKDIPDSLEDKIRYFETLKDFDGSMIYFEDIFSIDSTMEAVLSVFNNSRRVGLFIDLTMPSEKMIIGYASDVFRDYKTLEVNEHTKITLIINGNKLIWTDGLNSYD